MSARRITRYEAADKKAGMTVSELWEIMDGAGDLPGVDCHLKAETGIHGQIKVLIIQEVPRAAATDPA